jgi:uncharacterized membrane protein
VTSWWYLIVFGAVLALWAFVRWIRSTRHEIDELPPGH